MPLIRIQTPIAPDSDRVESLLATLSGKLSTQLGKPESYIMTAFEPGVAMTFGGSSDPTCFVEIKSVGTMSPDQTRAMSADFCETIEAEIGIPKQRTYIEFADARGAMWGWNGRTFG